MKIACAEHRSRPQVWEGGIRVPFIARWPGRIPAGSVSDAPFRSLDIFPTILRLAGLAMPRHVVIDGRDQSEFLLSGGSEEANAWLQPGQVQFHWCGTKVIAARVGYLKLFWAMQKWCAQSARRLWAGPGYSPAGARAPRPSPSTSPEEAKGIGTYNASICTECCPEAGFTAGLLGSTTVCQCSDDALAFPRRPVVFDMRVDRNETQPLEETDPRYIFAEREATEALRRLEKTLPSRVWPTTSMLPIPLTIWPCCEGFIAARPNCTADMLVESLLAGTETVAAVLQSCVAPQGSFGDAACSCDRCGADTNCSGPWP